MSRQSITVLIKRSPEDVFAYMDDVSREHEWQPSLRSATQDPPGPSTVGTRKRYVSSFLGRTVENTYVVTAIEPGRQVTYQTEKGSTVDAQTEITWEPEGSGTKVTMSVVAKPRGALRFVPRALLDAASREELEAAMKRLKQRLESS